MSILAGHSAQLGCASPRAEPPRMTAHMIVRESGLVLIVGRPAFQHAGFDRRVPGIGVGHAGARPNLSLIRIAAARIPEGWSGSGVSEPPPLLSERENYFR